MVTTTFSAFHITLAGILLIVAVILMMDYGHLTKIDTTYLTVAASLILSFGVHAMPRVLFCKRSRHCRFDRRNCQFVFIDTVVGSFITKS